LSIAALILVVAVAFPLLIFLMQDSLIFHPQPLAETQRAEIRKRFPGVEEIFLDSEGRKLHAWHVKGTAGAPLVIYFGGNAEEVSWMIDDARARVPDAGWLLVSYPGYGASEGAPSAANISAAALRWHDYAMQTIKPRKIAAFGRSLGSGAAVFLASQRKLDAVILVTPFDSLADVARRHYPFLPVGLMLRHRFDSVDLAPGITAPLLCLIAERDEVIPAVHGARLCDAWGGMKRKVVLLEAGHNTTDAHPLFWTSIREFFAQKVN
jgi:pimeloyl-ACP methyl ester carboxylesterase